VTPPEAPGRSARKPVRGNATQHPASPARPPTRCTTPDCDRKHYAKGLCKRHYMRDWRSEQPPKPRKPKKPRCPQTLLGGYSDDRENVPRGGSTLTLFPARPKRITDALHALAESRPTPSEYERRKAQILTSH